MVRESEASGAAGSRIRSSPGAEPSVLEHARAFIQGLFDGRPPA